MFKIWTFPQLKKTDENPPENENTWALGKVIFETYINLQSLGIMLVFVLTLAQRLKAWVRVEILIVQVAHIL